MTRSRSPGFSLSAVRSASGRRAIALLAASAAIAPAALLVMDAPGQPGTEEAVPEATPLSAHGYRGLRLMASQRLLAGHPAQAVDLALAALRRAPLDATSLRLLAVADRAAGGRRDEIRLLELGSRISWRDPPTQRLLLKKAYLDEDADGTVDHADALLRLKENRSYALAALQEIALAEPGRTALARRLAQNPPWRTDLLTGFSVAGQEDATAALDLLRAVDRTARPVTSAEARKLTASLIAAGYGRQAFAYWQSKQGDDRPIEDGSDDPDLARAAARFLRNEEPLPFGWTAAQGQGMQVIGERDAAGRPALAMQVGSDGVERFLWRNLVLPAGAYGLGFAASLDDAPTDRVHAGLICFTASGRLPLTIEGTTDRDRYRITRTSFRVPADCPTLSLSLSLSPLDDGRSHSLAVRGLRLFPQGR